MNVQKFFAIDSKKELSWEIRHVEIRRIQMSLYILNTKSASLRKYYCTNTESRERVQRKRKREKDSEEEVRWRWGEREREREGERRDEGKINKLFFPGREGRTRTAFSLSLTPSLSLQLSFFLSL